MKHGDSTVTGVPVIVFFPVHLDGVVIAGRGKELGIRRRGRRGRRERRRRRGRGRGGGGGGGGGRGG